MIFHTLTDNPLGCDSPVERIGQTSDVEEVARVGGNYRDANGNLPVPWQEGDNQSTLPFGAKVIISRGKETIYEKSTWVASYPVRSPEYIYV